MQTMGTASHQAPMLERKNMSKDQIKLMHGDCLEMMHYITDASVDMVLCDVPYGITACKWDAIIAFEPMWQHLNRITKKSAAIVMTSSQPFTTKLIASNYSMFKYCWVWDKHIPRGFQCAKYKPMMQHEDVVVFGKGKIKYFPQMTEREKPKKSKNYSKKESSNQVKYNSGTQYIYTHKNPTSIIKGKWEPNKGKIHPTQKPVSLMEYLIHTYTNANDTVLDFAMGSGTTGIACKNTDRNFIGIEINEDYFQLANNRISAM